MKRLIFVTAIALVLGFSTLAHADLINNGGNLIYDTTLNVTWYDPPPTDMTNSAAMTWAAGLIVGGTTAGSWSLPSTLPVHGANFNYNFSINGSTDNGFNISAPRSVYPGSTSSEMAYLFYVELGNIAYVDVSGNTNSGYGFVNKGPFTNIPSSGAYYWSVPLPTSDNLTRAWFFSFDDGGQSTYDKTLARYALAVHSGDVAPVPIPGAFWLLGSGLIGLVGLRRRRRLTDIIRRL